MPKRIHWKVEPNEREHAKVKVKLRWVERAKLYQLHTSSGFVDSKVIYHLSSILGKTNVDFNNIVRH